MAWDLMQLVPAVLMPYTNIFGTTLFFGLFFGFIVLGFFARNKSVRLVSILFIILSPLIMTSGVGISWGMPTVMQSIGQALLAAGIAGVLLSFLKK